MGNELQDTLEKTQKDERVNSEDEDWDETEWEDEDNWDEEEW
jgi:hypothetical protein